MSCEGLTVVALRKILVENNVPERSKYKTKAGLCEVIAKLGLLSKKITPVSKEPSRFVVKQRPQKAKSAKRALTAEKPLALVDSLIHHGFIPKHKAHEAQEALSYLQRLVNEFPATKQCIGNGSFGFWFDYLLRQEQFHPSLRVTPLLNLQEQQDRSLKINDTPKNVDIIKARIEEGYNTVIPIGLRYYSQSGGHANMLLINRQLKSYEWFEPNGHFSAELGKIQSGESKHSIETSLELESFLKTKAPQLLNIPSTYKFLLPYEECLYSLGPQAKADADMLEHCAGKGGGYCLAFSTIYAHLRFLAPEATPAETVRGLTDLTNREILHLVVHYIGWQNAVGITNTLTAAK